MESYQYVVLIDDDPPTVGDLPDVVGPFLTEEEADDFVHWYAETYGLEREDATVVTMNGPEHYAEGSKHYQYAEQSR